MHHFTVIILLLLYYVLCNITYQQQVALYWELPNYPVICHCPIHYV